MKNFLIVLTSILLILVGTSSVFAQDATTVAPTVTTATANKIDVESSLGSQSVWNNKIPLTVKFRTNFDSDHIEITWDTPSGIDVSSTQAKFLKVVAGQTYTYVGYVTPINAGSYSISSNVTAWQFDTNYTASSDVTLKIGSNLHIDPLPADYIGMSVLKYAIFAIGGGLAIYGLFLLFKKFSKIFIKWLRPPL